MDKGAHQSAGLNLVWITSCAQQALGAGPLPVYRAGIGGLWAVHVAEELTSPLHLQNRPFPEALRLQALQALHDCTRMCKYSDEKCAVLMQSRMCVFRTQASCVCHCAMSSTVY